MKKKSRNKNQKSYKLRSSIIFEKDQTSTQTKKIQNQELKSFQLLDCDTLVKAKIEAPNLISFDYLGYLGSFFPMITCYVWV